MYTGVPFIETASIAGSSYYHWFTSL